MKVGVIGLGGMGKHHARVYRELGVLSSIMDISPENLKYSHSLYGATPYTDLPIMLEKENLDAVSIAVPTPSHLDITESCLKAGCHVLLEKPLSDNLKDAEEIIELAKKSDRILATGYIERYNPAFIYLQELIKKGSFGEITSINIKRVGGVPRSATNVILDLMTHDFNLLMSLFDREPIRMYTHKHYQDGILDSAQALLDFGTTSATCESNWVSPIKIRQIHLTGTNGYCEVDLIKQELTEIHQNIRTTTSFNVEPLKQELNAFLKAIELNSTTPIITGEDALRTLKVTMEAIK